MLLGNGADRWFDKHQLIVLADGTVRWRMGVWVLCAALFTGADCVV